MIGNNRISTGAFSALEILSQVTLYKVFPSEPKARDQLSLAIRSLKDQEQDLAKCEL